MKIAIASNGNSLDSKIDRCFCKCRYFMIYDTVCQEWDFVRNICGYFNVNAGKSIIKMMIKHKIEMVISLQFGINTLRNADNSGIKTLTINDENINMKEVISFININKF